jgi:hypothetical protein
MSAVCLKPFVHCFSHDKITASLWSRVLTEQLRDAQLANKSFAFYETFKLSAKLAKPTTGSFLEPDAVRFQDVEKFTALPFITVTNSSKLSFQIRRFNF